MRSLPFADETLMNEVGVAALGGEKGYHDAREAVDAADVRGEWTAVRLHRRGREDRAAGEGDGEGELPARPESGSDHGSKQLMKAHVARVAPPGVKVDG